MEITFGGFQVNPEKPGKRNFLQKWFAENVTKRFAGEAQPTTPATEKNLPVVTEIETELQQPESDIGSPEWEQHMVSAISNTLTEGIVTDLNKKDDREIKDCAVTVYSVLFPNLISLVKDSRNKLALDSFYSVNAVGIAIEQLATENWLLVDNEQVSMHPWLSATDRKVLKQAVNRTISNVSKQLPPSQLDSNMV